jgi:hypothetical protein
LAKIKKYKLIIDNDYNYDLIGICSHFPDYHIVWGINDQLKLNLTKAKDPFIITNSKGDENKFPYYYSFIEVKQLEVYFIKNKFNGNYLIQEKHQFDYFIFLCDNFAIEMKQFLEDLRKIPSVMLAYQFDPKIIPSTEFILF